MSIQITAQLIVGYRFSDLCVVNQDEIRYITEKLKKEVSKKFEDGFVDIEEVTPELLSLILDLDFIEFSNKEDAIIGKKIENIDIGTNDQEIRDYHEIEMAVAEIKTKVEAIDSKIVELVKIKISTIGNTKIGEE